jgi:hypothetical protein
MSRLRGISHDYFSLSTNSTIDHFRLCKRFWSDWNLSVRRPSLFYRAESIGIVFRTLRRREWVVSEPFLTMISLRRETSRWTIFVSAGDYRQTEILQYVDPAYFFDLNRSGWLKGWSDEENEMSPSHIWRIFLASEERQDWLISPLHAWRRMTKKVDLLLLYRYKHRGLSFTLVGATCFRRGSTSECISIF